MDDDPLISAERQMVEHELDLVRRLYAKGLTRLSGDPTEWPSVEELQEALMSDPETAELADRLRKINQFRGRKGDED
jgi:hypothetical protein